MTSHEDADEYALLWARTSTNGQYADALCAAYSATCFAASESKGVWDSGDRLAATKHYNHLSYGSHLHTSSAYAEHNFRHGCSDDS